MSSLDYDSEFCPCVRAAVPRFATDWLNQQQEIAVGSNPSPPLYIIAGPGTGKTTVLALRVLRHIFVDGMRPEGIMATTFTRKAASELRSRVLSWGVATYQEVLRQAQVSGNQNRVDWLLTLDLNRVRIGTLDSLVEDMIADDRRPGEITPVVIEGFMARGLLRQNVMFTGGYHRNLGLQAYLNSFNTEFPRANDFASKLKICHAFSDRVIHDGVDLNTFRANGPGPALLADVVGAYHAHLSSHRMMDFALLENEVLDRLRAGRLLTPLQGLQALLVDEFQDTNYLQEQIYHELCSRSNASLTVVGDDDQSIYRFRGATVEIFANFASRLPSAIGTPVTIPLVDNYRSTERIVNYFNHYIAADAAFQPARAPLKAGLRCNAAANWANDPSVNLPVFGMFRSDVANLATDLCALLQAVFSPGGFAVPLGNGTVATVEGGTGGNFGDAVLLGSKVQEFTGSGAARLPLLMRNSLAQQGVEVFNPRGRDLAAVDNVALCLGIMLECIDPAGRVQDTVTTMKPATAQTLNDWRAAANAFATTNPNPGGLARFIQDWGRRNAPNMQRWPREWPLLDLMFTVVSWLPTFQHSPEGQVYLEAIARTITQAGQLSYLHATVYHGTSNDDNSVKHIIREIMEPLAQGDVEVDEEVMPYVPRNVFPMMTIHQAKGLEFPMVILDVGSDYKSNHHSQKPFRYPAAGGNLHLTEDEVASSSPVGPARQMRTPLQRAFDDLKRQYFVAKSRPQMLLLIAGLTTQLGQNPRVQSVATGDVVGGNRVLRFIPAAQWVPSTTAGTVALI